MIQDINSKETAASETDKGSVYAISFDSVLLTLFLGVFSELSELSEAVIACLVIVVFPILWSNLLSYAQGRYRILGACSVISVTLHMITQRN